MYIYLTFEVPITTAADDKFCESFLILEQEISLKKIFGGSQILTILTQLNDEIPLYPLSLHAGKEMFTLKPANLEIVVMFLVSLLLGALFAERYASESFQILGTSPAKAREQCY